MVGKVFEVRGSLASSDLRERFSLSGLVMLLAVFCFTVEILNQELYQVLCRKTKMRPIYPSALINHG